MKKFLSVILSLLVLVTSVVLGLSPAAETSAEENNAAGLVEQMVNKDTPDGFDPEGDNPYSVGKNENFLLSEQNELLFYVSRDASSSSGGNKATEYIYDEYEPDYRETKSNINSINDYTATRTEINLDKSGPSGSASQLKASRLNYVQAVGFNPTGSGRNDYVAYVGSSNYQDGGTWITHVLVIVQNAKTGAECSIDLGSAEWLKSVDLDYYAGSAYFTVTAGDYDNDGKDTLVVAYPGDGGAEIYEINCNLDSSNNVASLSHSSNLLNISYENGIRRDIVNKYINTSHPKHVTLSLATGDFDGDSVEELVVATGVPAGDYDEASIGIEGISTSITLMKKSGGWNNMAPTSYLWAQGDISKESSSKKTYKCTAMLQGNVAAGDINNDGLDEIIAVGYLANVKQMVSETAVTYTDSGDKTLNGSNYGADMLVFDGANSVLVDNGLESLGMSEFVQCNFDKTLSVEPGIQIATAYTNGRACEKEVFIDGQIYNLSTGAFTASCSPSISGQSFTTNMDGSTPCNMTFIGDVAAGNFDNNEAGREQFAYTCMFKEKTNSNDYHCYLAICAGAKFADDNDGTYGKIEKYAYSDVRGHSGDYWDNSSNDKTASQVFSGKGSHWTDTKEKYLNAVLASVDVDDDGLVGRYDSNYWIYTDPDVVAVLEGAPYFGDLEALGAYDELGETCYGLSISYEKGTSEGDSVSFGVGYNHEIEVDGKVTKFKHSLELGYSLDWSHSFEKSYCTTWSSEFSVVEDSVVITQIPITLYAYDIYNTETGSYGDKDYVMSVPGEPEYIILSVEEFNDFVDEYNSYISAHADGNPVNKLMKITTDDLPDAQGNPYKYWSKNSINSQIETVLSRTSYAMGHSGGATTSSYEYEKGKTESTEMAHGFNFSTSFMWGGGPYSGGFYLNLDYSHSKGSFTSNSEGTSISATVQNPARVDGISKEQLNQYGFRWQLASWNRCLTEGSDNKTPFYGYSLTNVTSPVANPRNLDVVLNKNESDPSKSTANLIWEAPELLPGGPALLGYNVYIDGQKWNDTPVTDLSATVYPIDADSEHTITVCAVTAGTNAESPDSNEVTIGEAPEVNSIVSIVKDAAYTSDDGLTDRYIITMTDGSVTYFYVTNGKDGTNGQDGQNGQDGKDGKSAYEMAVANGYQGTLEQWLEMIGSTCGNSHSFVEYSIAASCGKKGISVKVCSACGFAEVSEIMALSHSYKPYKTVEPTCSSNGYTVYKCENCSDCYTADEVAATGHDYEVLHVVHPSCVEKGFTIYCCKYCGVSYKGDETDIVDHVPGSWICDDASKGHYVKKCDKCGEILDEKTSSVVVSGGDVAPVENGETIVVGYGETIVLSSESAGHVIYTSSDPSVAVVDSNGVVSAKNGGNVTITVTDTDTGISTSFNVNVKMTWWQKLLKALDAIVFFRVLFMILGITV